MTPARLLPALLLGVVLTVVAGVVTYSVLAARELPTGPSDVVWDKAACAACGMHVGEPPFAAQLITKDGKVHVFDDPGCLFLYEAEEAPDVHGRWFRHLREARWIAGTAVAFAAVSPTPMGFGLGAVDAGTPGAITLGEARARCLERRAGQGR